MPVFIPSASVLSCCIVVVVELIGSSELDVFSYYPSVFSPTFFLTHRYEASLGEVLFLAWISRASHQSSSRQFVEKLNGMPLFCLAEEKEKRGRVPFNYLQIAARCLDRLM